MPCSQSMANSNSISTTEVKWYALRDLKRPNAIRRAWEILQKEKRMEVFTPKKWVLATVKGERKPKEIALVPDLLFVHETKAALDPIIESTETLQYRFRKYGRQNEPLVVPDADMERFIHAVNNSANPKYYLPEEITPQMYGKEVLICGGPLDGYKGRLLTMRGSKVKRLLVELKDFLCVAVEVNPEYIQFAG